MIHKSFKNWINVSTFIVILIEWTYLAKYGWEGPMIPYAMPMPICPNQIKGIKLVDNGLISFNNLWLVILTQIWKLTNRMLFLDIYQNILFHIRIILEYVLELNSWSGYYISIYRPGQPNADSTKNVLLLKNPLF